MTRLPVAILSLALLLIAGSAFAAGTPAPAAYTKNVAIVLYPGVEILDFGGPAEVFAAAAGFGRSGEQRAFNVYTVGATTEGLLSQGFIRVQPEFSIDNAPRPDIIVIPGGASSSLTNDPRFMAWAAKAVSDADLTLTVCTGAFVLSRLGVLDGLDVTTFYRAIPRLRQETPKARVHEGRRFIDNGKYVTTAGVSAGIDGSLHVVARLLGRAVADRTAQYMEYRWTPETHLASSYDHLNPQLDAAGRARQAAAQLLENGRAAEAVTAYRAMLQANPDDAEAVFGVATALHDMGSFAEAAEAFTRAAAAGARRPVALFNSACAFARAGQSEKALQALEAAVAAGFDHKMSLLHDDDLASIRADARFRKIVASL